MLSMIVTKMKKTNTKMRTQSKLAVQWQWFKTLFDECKKFFFFRFICVIMMQHTTAEQSNITHVLLKLQHFKFGKLQLYFLYQ